MGEKTYYPHDLWRMDFFQLLLEAKRQEDIHPENQGELDIAKKKFYFSLWNLCLKEFRIMTGYIVAYRFL